MFLCLIPYDIAKYIALGYGLISSSVFLLFNLFIYFEDKADKLRYVVLGIALAFQVGLYFTLKFYFFDEFKVIKK